MRLISLISRLVVGALFIFSGLIKLNDPYGTAYKLEEYFEVFAADGFPFFLNFVPYSLFTSVFLSASEVILGVAILIYYRMAITKWISLLLISFFTFLTYYSFVFDKVKDCGCFGTAIKLTPEQSFYKDLILLVMILVIFFHKKDNANFDNIKGNFVIVAITLISFGAGYYSINHLPFFDPTPYKVGNDLKILTKPKETARYEWIVEKNGKEFRFDNEHYPSDTTYKYKGRTLLTDSTLLVPEIAGFMIYNDEVDYSQEALIGSKLFVTIQNTVAAMENCSGSCMESIKKGIKGAESLGVKVIILTAPTVDNSFEDYRHYVQLSGDYYYLDDTVLKTIIRSNPGMFLLKDGVIKGKWHFNDTPDIETIKKSLNN